MADEGRPQAISLLNLAAQTLRREQPGDVGMLRMIELTARALQAATNPDDVKLVRDKANVLAHFCRLQREYRDFANEFLLLQVQAERRVGQYLMDTVRAGSHHRTLPRGISGHQSAQWQSLARVPDDLFNGIVERLIEHGVQLSTVAILRRAGRPPSYATAAEEPRAAPSAKAMPLALWQARGGDGGPEAREVVALVREIEVADFVQHFPGSLEGENDATICAVIIRRRANRLPDTPEGC